MISSGKIKEFIFDSSIPLEERARKVLQYQLSSVAAYRLFVSQIGHEHPIDQHGLAGLPFLPIELFRTYEVCAEDRQAVLKFTSSGTTGSTNSVHPVADIELYHNSIEKCFGAFYGPASSFAFFALLPSYLEQGGSSLVYMVRHLIESAGCSDGGFYKYDHAKLLKDLDQYSGNRKKVLIGVSFALWEMAERFPDTDLSDVIIMETGGMKGRKKEIIREELHDILTSAFNVADIHSEYGMTELLSQAYSSGNGIYRCPHWMKVLVRDPYDPLNVQLSGRGALNIIDLANLYSCSFIATNDVGVVYEDGSFEVKGRMDGSALRGCNLMF